MKRKTRVNRLEKKIAKLSLAQAERSSKIRKLDKAIAKLHAQRSKLEEQRSQLYMQQCELEDEMDPPVDPASLPSPP